MISMDFSLARLNHQIWKMRLRSYLDGKEELEKDEAVSHRECDLGKWLYDNGLEKYGSLPEMQQLERAHADLHLLVKRIIDLKMKNQTKLAEEEYTKVGSVSKEIISLLEVVEHKIK